MNHSGVDAKFEGKNDLKVDGFKISGNAEHVHGNRVLHHGTLLFSTSLEMLHNSIRKDKSSYTSRAVASNPSSITNLNGLIDCSDISEFRTEMTDYFLKKYKDIIPIEISQIEGMKARAMAISKYQTWEWNWAYGPEYSFENTFMFNTTAHRCRLSVKDGIIIESSIEGSARLKNTFRKTHRLQAYDR